MLRAADIELPPCRIPPDIGWVRSVGAMFETCCSPVDRCDVRLAHGSMSSAGVPAGKGVEEWLHRRLAMRARAMCTSRTR